MSGSYLLNEFRPLSRFLEEPLSHSVAAFPALAHDRQFALPDSLSLQLSSTRTINTLSSEAELPGVRKEDLTVSVTEGTALTIAGSRVTHSTNGASPGATTDTSTSATGKAVSASFPNSSTRSTVVDSVAPDAAAKTAHTNERQITPSVSAGDSSSSFCFSHTAYVPGRIQPSTLSARLENGVLMVEIPKAKTMESTEVTIL